MGLITKGMGVVLKHIKKGKKLKTVYRVKPSVDISRFKKSKKHGLVKKLDVWANRETGKILSQAGHGVNIKYTKKGKPYVHPFFYSIYSFKLCFFSMLEDGTHSFSN